MRLNINLATHPYEDAREFGMRWGTAMAVAVIVTGLLGQSTWINYSKASRDRASINKLQAELDDLDRRQKENEMVRDRPENRDIGEQKDFWNNVIDEKSFSWTQLFSDLEKIMPNRCFVQSVQPSITPEKRVKLRLLIAGETHDNAAELVRKMETSERFRFPSILSETLTTQAGKAPQMVFEIETYYSPVTANSGSSTKEGL